jgi:hypothetical protein
MKGVYEQLTQAIRQVEVTLKQREHSDNELHGSRRFPAWEG